MKKKFVIFLVFFLYLFLVQAYACKCMPPETPVLFNQASAVFIGRVLWGTEKMPDSVAKRVFEKIPNELPEAGDVHFVVEEVFKGNLRNYVVISLKGSEIPGVDCDEWYSRGERFIVYAYGKKGNGQNLGSNACVLSRVHAYSNNNEELNFLRNLPPPGSGGNIRGNILVDLKEYPPKEHGTPLPNIKINIINANNIITVKTDKKGQFQVKIKPGEYKIKPEFPKHYIEREFKEVTVDDLGTAEANFYPHLDGNVSGHIITRKGGGHLLGLSLKLLAKDNVEYGNFQWDNIKDGFFEIDSIPPGQYILFMETDFKKSKKLYYPGTFQRKTAKVINIKLGEKIKGIELSLPKEMEIWHP